MLCVVDKPNGKEPRMRIGIQTPGIHHVSLRSANLQRSRQFYSETLGFPILVQESDFFIVAVGANAIGVKGPDAKTPPQDTFNPFRVGLDHAALACPDEQELQRVAKALSAAGIENTGVKLDEALGKRYVAFKDPDRIAWEFYSA